MKTAQLISINRKTSSWEECSLDLSINGMHRCPLRLCRSELFTDAIYMFCVHDSICWRPPSLLFNDRCDYDSDELFIWNWFSVLHRVLLIYWVRQSLFFVAFSYIAYSNYKEKCSEIWMLWLMAHMRMYWHSYDMLFEADANLESACMFLFCREYTVFCGEHYS